MSPYDTVVQCADASAAEQPLIKQGLVWCCRVPWAREPKAILLFHMMMISGWKQYRSQSTNVLKSRKLCKQAFTETPGQRMPCTNLLEGSDLGLPAAGRSLKKPSFFAFECYMLAPARQQQVSHLLLNAAFGYCTLRFDLQPTGASVGSPNC